LIIVDASVAVQWIAEEDTSKLSDALLTRDDLWAPELLQIEVGNALRRKVFVGEISMDQAKAGLRFIRDKVSTVPLTLQLLDRAMELAELMYHPIYDCVYLAAAQQNGARVVTFDQDLIKGAVHHGFADCITSLPMESAP
jgi:predicted nucleic acid-binding protein